MKKEFLILLSFLICCSCGQTDHTKDTNNLDNMIIRISEIEIDPNYLDEYISILKEESEASIKLEQGVVSIYPMFQTGKRTEIRILEIYKDTNAYESHLQTSHFKHYKMTTQKMVKSLKLIDMTSIDGETMPLIFKKLGQSDPGPEK